MKRTYLLISFVISIFLLLACGGGGGGGDDTTPISYTGLKTPAFITSENAEDMAEGVFGPDTDGFASTDLIAVVSSESDTVSSLPSNLVFSQMLANVVLELDFTNLIYLPGATVTETDTQQCDSGSITITLTVDTVTGDFSGSMSFNDCVISDVYTNGVANVVGLYDISTETIPNMTMTFTEITESYDSESYTYSGKIVINQTTLSITQTIDYLVRDNISGKVFMYADYKIVLTDYISEVQITINGRFYHPDNGYIDIITSNVIYVDYNDDWPYAGVVVATGDNSSLMIDCEGDSILTYTLSVDADGDGIYETVSIENW